MSNSQRAKEWRLKRKRLSKSQRGNVASQHEGDSQGRKKPKRIDRDKALAAKLGLIQQ